MSNVKIGTKPASSPRPAEVPSTKGKAHVPAPARPLVSAEVADGFRPSPAPATRPPAIRDAGELAAPWRAVQMTETAPDYNGVNPGSAIGSLNETSTQYWPHVNQDFKNHVAGDLKNFLKFGTSSLTPYETNQLTKGLFGANVDSHGYGESEKYQIGDRLEFATKDAQGKAVTQRGIYYGSGVITALDGKFTMIPLMNPNGDRPITIEKVVAGALLDGRH